MNPPKQAMLQASCNLLGIIQHFLVFNCMKSTVSAQQSLLMIIFLELLLEKPGDPMPICFQLFILKATEARLKYACFTPRIKAGLTFAAFHVKGNGHSSVLRQQK
jgi:hypothetical protein